jgi:hypothetical protein
MAVVAELVDTDADDALESALIEIVGDHVRATIKRSCASRL